MRTIETTVPAAIPKDLAGFRDLHTGATAVVCGCGTSIADLAGPERLLTIGVNDVGRLFQPTYLVVLNPRRQFKGERFRYVEQSRARAIFTQLDLGLDHPRVVRFQLGRRGGTDLSDPDRLPHTRNSPYVALALAAFMGAERIGLIGVDFTDHHFFAETGRHPLSRRLAEIDREYGRLAAALREGGVEVVNLSRQSRLTTLPKLEPEAFFAGVAASRPRARIEEKDMQIAVDKRPGTSVVSTFLDTFATTAEAAGFRVLRNPAALDHPAKAVTVVWNGRRHRARGPTVYAEHGWLPRSSYQVSPAGINADSHAADFHWDGRRLAESEREAVRRHLDLLRRGDETLANDLRTDAAPAADLSEEFLLVPLQMEWDTNIRRHVPARFRKMQALVAALAAADPPWPVIFKQHPSDARRNNDHLRLRPRRQQDVIRPHREGNVHQLLKSGRCRAIVSLNSNVVHDGLIWDVPSAVLGRGVWPSTPPSPFYAGLPSDWDDFERHVRSPETTACREAYVLHLIRHQWSAEDIADVEKVGCFLDGLVRDAHREPQDQERRSPVRKSVSAKRSAPKSRPKKPSFTKPVLPTRLQTGSDVVVNVVARDLGWLFEDLKSHFRGFRRAGVRVVTSTTAQDSADSWIYLRAREANRSPDPKRTVVQIHDLFDEGLYRPGGQRACVARCGGVTLTHPEERRILEASGIDLDAKQVLERPLGALGAFQLRTALPKRFTVAWVGRPSRIFGQSPKRLGWFVEAMRLLGGELRVVLLGERLEKTCKQLKKAGIDVVLHPRSKTPIKAYPRLYQGFDAVAVTSAFAAGPNCLFEALATGVPVVATPAGWVPELVRDGENGFRVSSIEEMAAALGRLRAERQTWFERRAAIRESLGGWTLESWVAENVDMAMRLARPEPARPEPAKESAASAQLSIDPASIQVLLVGNGPSAGGRFLGSVIDNAPKVVRFNAYETAGFEPHVGRRVDAWAVNQNRVTRARLEQWSSRGFSVPRIQVVPCSGEPRLRRNVEEVASLARRLYPDTAVEEIPCRVAVELEKALGGSRPTAGLVTLAYYLEQFEKVHVCGFDVLRRGDCPSVHYWGGSSTIRSIHDPVREGEWLQERIREGRVVAL